MLNLRAKRFDAGLTRRQAAYMVGLLEEQWAEMEQKNQFSAIVVDKFLDRLDQRLWIREHRKLLGVTRKRLAELLGIKPGAVKFWEEGREKLPVRRKNQMIELLRAHVVNLNKKVKELRYA